MYTGDNVLVEVGPTASESYRFDIDEHEQHQAGTFWYHPHVHGSTAIQVGSGMAGAFIIEGAVDAITGIAEAREVFAGLERCDDLARAARGHAPEVNLVATVAPPAFGHVESDRASGPPDLPGQIRIRASNDRNRLLECGNEGEGNVESVKGHGLVSLRVRVHTPLRRRPRDTRPSFLSRIAEGGTRRAPRLG